MALLFSFNTFNTFTYRQKDKRQFWYEGALKPFVKIMYSIEAVKTEAFFTSLTLMCMKYFYNFTA